MTSPLFTIVTRTIPGRETLLARNMDSVRVQAEQVEHLIIRDDARGGVGEAQKLLWSVNPKGRYVLVLDDDDYLSAPDALERVAALIAKRQPPFLVCKVAHGELGTMPRRWEQSPTLGEITVSNVLTRNDIWMATRQHFTDAYAGDFAWIQQLFWVYTPQWIDIEVVTVEQRRMGAIA